MPKNWPLIGFLESCLIPMSLHPGKRAEAMSLNPELGHDTEREKGLIVESVSLATTDDKKFGASVDGAIDDDGMSEYKAFNDPDKCYDIITQKDDFMQCVRPQIQGGLWITGREWCDFCLYCPQLESAGLDFVSHRIYRDDNYIEDMESKLLAFDRYVESLVFNLVVSNKGFVSWMAHNNQEILPSSYLVDFEQF